METESLALDPGVQAVLSRAYPLKAEEDRLAEKTDDEIQTLPDLLQWLAKPPMFTTLRVNTVAITTPDAKELVEKELDKQCAERGAEKFVVKTHHCLADCLVINNTGPHIPQEQADIEVIVDIACGMAVLRGADVFKQGILGASTALHFGDRVRVMSDLDGKCLRGFTQTYEGKKLYVGTGISLVSREELFCADPTTLRGVGIQMTEPLYQAPSLSDILPNVVFAQNLPSIVCGHVIDPTPGQTIIDMCAAPGGKTCHIATLMNDKGRVVALDKTEDKVSKIMNNASRFGLSCIEAYAFDARKAVEKYADPSGGPPYPPSSFDAVLLDGPCSALGQRPAAQNPMSRNTLASFPKLQRNLLNTAVTLLKPGGVLVYSTCTVTIEENEDQVAWILQTFPDITLEQQRPHLGGYGLAQSSIPEDKCSLVQRFHPRGLSGDSEKACDSDTIGFFIAKFRKQEK